MKLEYSNKKLPNVQIIMLFLFLIILNKNAFAKNWVMSGIEMKGNGQLVKFVYAYDPVSKLRTKEIMNTVMYGTKQQMTTIFQHDSDGRKTSSLSTNIATLTNGTRMVSTIKTSYKYEHNKNNPFRIIVENDYDGVKTKVVREMTYDNCNNIIKSVVISDNSSLSSIMTDQYIYNDNCQIAEHQIFPQSAMVQSLRYKYFNGLKTEETLITGGVTQKTIHRYDENNNIIKSEKPGMVTTYSWKQI